MKIALITLGTRGDVQPYVAVGCALASRGHEVTVGVSPEHESLVREYGLGFRRVGTSFRAMLESDLGRAWLSSGDSPIEYGRYAKQLFLPLQRPFLEEADAAVEGADAVLFYALAAGGLYAAERRGLPAVALAPWPLFPTREIAPLGAPWADGLPGFVKRALGRWVPRVAFGAMTAPHAAYRRTVGLPPLVASDMLTHVTHCGVPSIGLFSQSVLPRPADWPLRHEVAGFAFVPARPYSPPTALAEFLEAGPPPIYLGFGSMTGWAPDELAALATRAAKLAGVRAVVASGWAGLTPEPSADVFVLDEIPHDWLFPRVAAVVHHGGIGTFAEGLRAGKPTVIAAFFGDQPTWGLLNEKLGTGPRALRRRAITAEALAAAIRTAVTDRGMAQRADEVGRAIRAESGADHAAERIEHHVTRQRGT